MVETNIKNLVINKMTQAQYDALEEKDPNQLYYIVDDEMYVDVARLAVEVDAGKQLIAQAITDKGVPATADESLSELAEKVSEIDWNPNVGCVWDEGYEPKDVLDVLRNTNHLLKYEDNIIEVCSFNFFGIFPNITSLILGNCYSNSGSYGILNLLKLRYLSLPKMQSFSYGNGYASWRYLTINLPICTNFGGYAMLRGNYNIENLILGTVTTLSLSDTPQYAWRNLTVGENTNITLNLSLWDARDVIAEGQSGIDELNSNIQNNLVANLKDNTGLTAKTVTFGQALRNVLTAETEQMFADKNWNIAPAKTV